jgi:hypothetical protein
MEPQMSLEQEHEKEFTFTEISPIGYGNAESSISYVKQLESGELSPRVDERAAELMTSGELLVEVDEKDDGCIDGRPTESVLFVTEDGEFYEKNADNHNHERAKVAGGGYITSTAMRIGAGYKGDTINADILETGSVLTAKEIYCGAHTGEHKHADGTDCGANDKMLTIFNTAAKYETEIAGTTKALLEVAGLEFSSETFNEVMKNWQAAVDDTSYFEGSTGDSRLKATQAIVQVAHSEKQPDRPLSTIKHLAGDHKEDYLVVNYIKDKTVSQVKFADTLSEEFPELASKNLAQTFVVDAWRIVELAQASVEDDKREAAIYAGVMYQVATAATLTDGSLRTFIYA